MSGYRRWLVPIGAALVAIVLTAVLVLVEARPDGDRAEAHSTTFTVRERTELTARAAISTARVAARACPGAVRGSGFVVDGFLLTSGHLVVHATELKVERPGQPAVVPVLATSASLDLAVAAATNLVALDLESADANASVGEPILLAGFPDGQNFTAVEGSVVGYGVASEWGVPGRQAMLLSPGTRKGFSGGPVLDRHGQVVGMLAGVDATTGLAVAIPIEELMVVVGMAADTWSPDPVSGITAPAAHVAARCGR